VKKKSPPYHFIVAAVLGIACIFLIVRYAQTKEREKEDAVAAANAAAAQALADAKAKQVTVQETPTNLRPVLYATQPLEAGTRLSAAFFEKKLTPKDILPDAFTDGNDIIGWFAVRKIEKGDPLTPRNVGKSLPYMSQRISPGMRAISLPIFNADVNSTGGFIVDGDRVDLLYTVTAGENKIRLNTQTIMQNVNVLYVPGPQIKTEKTDGINPIPPPGDTISVTFEVTPEQAQALVFMSNDPNGRFTMILRARKDHSEVRIKPFAASDYDITNLTKVQRTVDKSVQRVKELADEIAAKEKADAASGTTNETTSPNP
jgi:Flp pilus assembly protein CpaB